MVFRIIHFPLLFIFLIIDLNSDIFVNTNVGKKEKKKKAQISTVWSIDYHLIVWFMLLIRWSCYQWGLFLSGVETLKSEDILQLNLFANFVISNFFHIMIVIAQPHDNFFTILFF